MTTKNIGVGPHPKPWPSGSRYDHELLQNGDKRNVIDKYRYMTINSIKTDLAKSCFDLHIAIENWQNDLNIGTIVRTANAFNVNTVHIIGKRHWNRRGAMVTDRYINVVHHVDVKSFVNCMNQSDTEIIAVDNVDGAKNLSQTKLPKNCVLVFGGEGPGLSDEIKNYATTIVQIEQFGSTRSVNVSVAAGIAMYAWLQHNILKKI